MGNPDHASGYLRYEAEWMSAGHGNWKIGHGKAEFCERTMMFRHPPRLSFRNPTGKEAQLRFAFGLPLS